MHKQIGTKRYDTETATRVSEWNNGAAHTDDLVSETLYRKLGGEYFLYCEGGAQTRYAQLHSDNEWIGGDKIIPLAYDNAYAWAQAHMTAEEVDNEFTVTADTDSFVRVSAAAKALVDNEARKSGRTIKDIVEGCIISTLA